MRPAGTTLPKLHLQPGQLLVTRDPQWIVTLLGSCVAVTMFNARFRLAAICHAMLPQPPSKDLPYAEPAYGFRYLSHAIPAIAERFVQMGLSPEEVEVKMFGGGNVIHVDADSQSDRWIGSANVEIAQRILKASHFRIKAQNVGGNRGCKIMFNTHSGEVLHKHLSNRNCGVPAAMGDGFESANLRTTKIAI